MSTFNGCVEEFPDIRIDYFRQIAGKTPPLVCFLSHIHSDHIQGLESLRAPFVYCSPATRELLLGLEKYPHRMNLAKGILETKKQTYKHLKNLLKTIPLNTPTVIERGPKSVLRATLLDANHCAGAVMFLIEDQARAILYTGDIRSEPWWVNALVRNPVVLPYCHGHKRLDKIYLDTTFANQDPAHRTFPSKAVGISELLKKVLMYPKDTVFHFQSWTPGYEDIHVDDYKCRLYKPLSSIGSDANPSFEGSALFGFQCGNRLQSGCLTDDPNVRLHSCEYDTGCPALDQGKVVYITPIIARSANGEVVPELGAGGGAGDLVQGHELELDSVQDILTLTKVCSEKIGDKNMRMKTLDFISDTLTCQKNSISLDALCLDVKMKSVTLVEFAQQLAKLVEQGGNLAQPKSNVHEAMGYTNIPSKGYDLPRTIQFPYSRHSSYDELCDLVRAFNPVDIYPCTIDDSNWDEQVSMRTLFGHLCSGTTFAHDREMEIQANRRKPSKSGKNSDGSPIAASLLEGAAGISPSQESSEHSKQLIIEEIFSHPAPRVINPDPVYRPSKRRRTNPPDTSKVNAGQQRLEDIRRSFKDHLDRVGESGGALGLLGKTQAEPIQVSDMDPPLSDEEAGRFLLDEMPEPTSVFHTAQCGQAGSETQISLSDAAFQSQSPQKPNAEEAPGKVQCRKEAYVAAKGLSGSWEKDYGLVSSFDGQREEELEL